MRSDTDIFLKQIKQINLKPVNPQFSVSYPLCIKLFEKGCMVSNLSNLHKYAMKNKF